MVLMDKMYIKLDQNEVPYKPQIYQRGRGQNRQRFGQENNWTGYHSFSRTILKVVEDMEGVEVTFREVIFEVDLIIELVDLGKIEVHGDNLDQEKEKGELGHHLVYNQDRELV